MNPEYRTIKQSLPALKKFLMDCPKEAADAFFAEELIPEELWKKVYNNYETVGELIQCLSGKMENYPGIFVKVLEVLVRLTGSETTVRTIKEKYAKCGGTRKLPRAPYEDPVSLPSGTPKSSSNEKPRPVVVTTTGHGSIGEQPSAHAENLHSHTVGPSSSDKDGLRLTQARDSRMSNEEDYLRYLPPAARPYLDKELDWDNDGVERDLCEIADQMSDWETKLAVPLGLTLTDIHDIKSKHPNQPVLQRRAALRNWKAKKALEGTYGNLLKAFVEANHKKCAQALCRVLKKRTGNESDQEPQPDSYPAQAEEITGVEQIKTGDDLRRESPHLRHRLDPTFVAGANDEDVPETKKDTRGKSGLTIYVVGGLGIIFLCVMTVIVLPPFLAETSGGDKGPSGPTKGTNRPATPETATPASGCHEVKDLDKLYNYLYNDIWDWEELCSRLGVKKGKMAIIRNRPQVSRKLYSCLEAFVDLGEPYSCWEKVVSTVCGPPFYVKKRLWKTIATEQGIAVPTECS